MTVAFVLSGGASAGASQVGMLQALLEAGIVPDVVVGASVGAINAVALAVDPTLAGVERLASVWRGLCREDIFPASKLALALKVARRRSHLLDAGPLRHLVERWLPIDDLAATVVPVHVATTELRTGRVRWWREGPVVDVLAASACLPGIFPPVVLDGDLHVDGAVVSAVPVTRALDLRADRIVVLDAGTTAPPVDGEPTSALDVVLWSMRAQRLSRLELDRAALTGTTVDWLQPPAGVPPAFDDFSRTGALIDAAYEATADLLAGVTAAGSGSPRPEPCSRHTSSLRRPASLPVGRGVEDQLGHAR